MVCILLLVLLFVFKDANGKTWVRDAAGDLKDKGKTEPAEILGLYERGEVPYGQEEYTKYVSN